MTALIAEDDTNTRRALKTILETEGWSVVEAPDGSAALSRFKTAKPQLVCLDIMMPGASGYDVCREIRKLDPAVPVLFISAKSEELDKVLGLELGADDFIEKPFGVHEVLARIRAILRRTNQAAAIETKGWRRLQNFRIGPWDIRPAELRAMGPDRMEDLSLREVRILDLLVRRSGEVVDREAFFRECWDLDQAPLSRTLDQHIARLRKKLEADVADPQLIRTVQGLGYRYSGTVENS